LTREKVPIYHKQNLTLEEAAEYSNIGINRLTMLIKNPHCNFVLHVGNKRLIKRKLFDEFIEQVDII
jgi:excisionase family DNA binding protein